jgi:hypothetical protein
MSGVGYVALLLFLSWPSEEGQDRKRSSHRLKKTRLRV